MTPVRCRRDPHDSDAIAGVLPASVFEPATLEECLDVFRSAREAKLVLAASGGGTELGLGGSPRRLDAVISTRRLDRVIEYAPSDQVVVVEAGTTLAALQKVLAKNGQRLACDPPQADRATVGGLLSTNAFGPLRTRYGSLRDLLIGVSIMRVDATVARGGGKVVKNVAGFDLPKLVVGALGTLGLIATATFRLHPLPEATTTLRIDGVPASAVRSLVAALQEEQIEPAAMVAIGRGGAFDVLVRFEGFAAGVAEQRERTRVLLRTWAMSGQSLSEAEARAAWCAHDAARTRGNTRMKIAAPPAALAAVTAPVTSRLLEALAGGEIILYPPLGLAFVSGDSDGGPLLSEAVNAARADLAPAPGSLVVHDLPAAARSRIDVWGPPPPALALMKRVKERFDPTSRLNPGRFVGGI